MQKKIAVYTICKNEEKNINDWLKNVQDADAVFVGDTGSSDGSIEALKAGNANVFNIQVSPWRFDHARNLLLESIPKDIDICIALDFDERLSLGWRSFIENAWKDDTTKLEYEYTDILRQYGSYRNTFITSKIHARNDYKWVYPVHEKLKYIGSYGEKIVFCKNLRILHTPDVSKNRLQYLNLLELAVKENPKDQKLRHALGRNYIQSNRPDDCISVMQEIVKDLTVSENLRKASIRFIGRALGEKGEFEKAKVLLTQLMHETPFCSSAYSELLALLYKNEKWDDIINMAPLLKSIDFNYKNEYNEFANAKTSIPEIISYAYYKKNIYTKALEYALIALSFDKENERLKQSVEYYRKRLS